MSTSSEVATSEQVAQQQQGQEDYQDRYLEGSHQFVAYDLLEARGKSGETDDPDVKRYQEAKALFRKGYDLCMTIPRSLEDDVLVKYEEDIKTSAETMVDAWLLDDKAAPMSERVLILGQQYEKVLLTNIPEDQKEGFFVKYSLLFSAWILLVGKQFDHCITTLSLAVDTYDDLTARIFFLRASCYFSTNQLELGIKDLEKSLELDSNFNLAYSILGSVYMSLNNRELALKNFEKYLENGHPDTPDNINALYSMSLLLQQPKSDNKDAQEYYQKAKTAEARFKDLYGTHVGMNDIKRQAIQVYETPEEANRMILAAMPKKQYNEKIEQLIKAGILNTSFPASPDNCSHCGAGHLKDSPGKALLCCGGYSPPMAHMLSLLSKHNKTLSSFAIFTLVFVIYRAQRHLQSTGQQGKRKVHQHRSATTARTRYGKSGSYKIGINSRFVEQMKGLLPICIPRFMSKESGLLIMLATVLVVRTWLDIWFSGFNGSVIKAIVSRNRKSFIAKIIFEFGLMMWPMSIVNNSLKLTISALSLSFRERLTKHAHNQYLDGTTFYRVSHLDNRLHNTDQLITQDIDKFSDNLSHLFSDIAKPVVDIVLFSYKLGEAIGNGAPFHMIAYFVMSGVLLRAFSPPFGRYTAIEQKLEGNFKFSHSRIITHSEEVAFYGGASREKEVVNSGFQKIMNHVRKVYTLRFLNGIFDSVLVKYCATMTAYYLLARPVFDPAYATRHMGAINDDPIKLMEDYSRNSSFLINLSQAVGRLILTGRDLTRFAGYTSRVAELFDVLADVRAGKYTRTMVSEEDGNALESQVIDTNQMKGKLIVQDGAIVFDKVPIVTPNNDVLLRELSFKVDRGMNTLVSGPNGSGKSSLFRILGNLWPLFGGTVVKPAANKLCYVPQKPYLPLGNFRDQIIYPDNYGESLAKGFTDEILMDLLETVHLSYLVEREGGWDAVQDWAEVLSGGEKQRVAMARLFYHEPDFAILDECTSEVSVDTEASMYEYARKVGMTLFTVSHRTSLVRHHEFHLSFDGEGYYEFRELDPGDINMAFCYGSGKSKPQPHLD